MKNIFRFSLRTLLALMGVATLAFAYYRAHDQAQLRNREAALAWIKAQGGQVWFEHQLAPDGGSRLTAEIGDRSIAAGTLRVHTILLPWVDHLDPIFTLTETRRIFLNMPRTGEVASRNDDGTRSTQGPSLLELMLLRNLGGGRRDHPTKSSRTVRVAGLAHMKDLEELELSGLPVEDIAPLKSLKKLTTLKLNSTQVKDVNALKALHKLCNLSLSGTFVEDLTPLHGLPGLRCLSLDRVPATDGAINAAKLALPSCSVDGSHYDPDARFLD